MTKEWYRRAGFRKNPLDIEPRFKDKLFGYDVLLDELFYRIESGNLIFLEGDIGKTSILLKVIEKYKGKGKVAYINCRKESIQPDIKKVVARGKKIMQKNEKGIKKDMILLLDNVAELSKRNAEWMKYYFDEGEVLSIIMTGKNIEKTNIPLGIKHRIGKRVYKLKQLTEDEAVDLIMERLDFSECLKEEDIYKIAAKSHNIKELFKNCETALEIMATSNLNTVDDKIINQIFGIKEDVMV